jgi:hypothetical protein
MLSSTSPLPLPLPTEGTPSRASKIFPPASFPSSSPSLSPSFRVLQSPAVSLTVPARALSRSLARSLALSLSPPPPPPLAGARAHHGELPPGPVSCSCVAACQRMGISRSGRYGQDAENTGSRHGTRRGAYHTPDLGAAAHVCGRNRHYFSQVLYTLTVSKCTRALAFENLCR